MSRQTSAAEELAAEIRSIFRDGLSIDVPSADTDLIDGGLLDSLTLVELMFQVEQRFDVELTLDELEIDDFRTIQGIADFIVRRQSFGIPKAV